MTGVNDKNAAFKNFLSASNCTLRGKSGFQGLKLEPRKKSKGLLSTF